MDKQKTRQTKLFEWFVRNKPFVLIVTNIFYIVLFGIILATTYSIYNDQNIYNFFAINRAWFGRVALLTLLLVITPGIIGRFGIDIKVSRIITVYRRRLGILVFVLAFTHFHIISLPRQAGLESSMIPIFQRIGFIALILLLFLFVTSNNFSVKRLGKWWKRLHRIVYVVPLLLLFHTAFQRISIWSILAGIFFVLELGSFIYAYVKGGSFFNKPRPKIE